MSGRGEGRGPSDALEALASRRFRLAMALTATMLVTYFGFLLLVAYDKPALGQVVTPGLSWGILLGALVIVTAWAVTGIYVRWANAHYDGALAKLKASEASPAEASSAAPRGRSPSGGDASSPAVREAPPEDAS